MERLLDILMLIILTPNNCLLFLSLSPYAEAYYKVIDELYVGCFIDKDTPSRLLPELQMRLEKMNPKICVLKCYAEGYLYAGIRIGIECWCGDILKDNQAASHECSTKCRFDGLTRECGAYWRISVYHASLPAKPSQTEIDGLYVGCFEDKSSRRLLLELHVKSNGIDPQKCVTICSNMKYLYAGLEFGDECWCGDMLQYYQVPRRECSSRCSNGGISHECGGHWRISVYRTTTLQATVNNIEIDDGLYVGCFEDESFRRLLVKLQEKSDTINPQRCVEMCYAKGYLYAGLEFGDECWCGDNLQHSQVPRNECSSRCSNGRKSYECGGDWRISVYQTTLSASDYYLVYSWTQLMGVYNWFGTNTRTNFKEFIVFGDQAGTSVFKSLMPRSLIPYCAEFCEWEAYFNNNGDKIGNSFYDLRTKTKDLLAKSVCLTVETTSMKGPLVLSLEHESKVVVLLEVKQMKTEGVQRLEAELPPEYKWKPVRLSLKFPSLTNFKEVKRIAGCIPGVNMDRYIVYMWENESPTRKFHAKDPAKGGTCENSGIFTGSGCICRAGFSGPSCENICGENRFGPNCEGRCSTLNNFCLGKMFCKRGVGCGCANGFTGEDCMTRCDEKKKYGVDCSKRCGSCLGDCNIYTGKCERGCKPGYVPPLCKDKWVHLADNYLTLEYVGHTTATFVVDLTNAVFSSKHQHAYHSIQYKSSLAGEEWNLSSKLKSTEETQILFLEGLRPRTDYKARLVVYNSAGDYYLSDDLLPHLDFRTTCSENPLEISLGTITASEISIIWKGTSNDSARCQTHYVDLSYSSCYDDKWSYYTASGGAARLHLLAPDTTYCIRTKQNESESYYYISAKTRPTGAI